jgi:hypothetical protein
MKMAVVWDVVSCSLADTDRRFRGAHHHDNRDSKLLWNVGQYLPDYMIQHPRRVIFILVAVRTSDLYNPVDSDEGRPLPSLY